MNPATSQSSSDVKFEIGHVLFIDIVGYSKLLITEQSEQIQRLKEIVRGTEQVRLAEAEGKLLRLPTGDGGALVFRNTPEAPVLCAIEIAKALKSHPELRVRMGIHSGPVNEITDLNEQANIAGAGINIAQRVMDCGDAGHILLSRHLAEDLEQYPRWQQYLHNLGDREVKHGVRVGIANLYADQVGNPQLPKKFQAFKKHSTRMRWAAMIAALLTLAIIVAGVGMFSRNRVPSTLAAPEKSIAVLPFENRSEDKANAYFADGIQDEILTRLSKIADLKVISRTSTQHYKSAPENLPEIARQLGVAHIVEGSVQKSGESVRVNVQLIKAANDAHLWADTFDRKLTDIFSVESEVAKAIADQLRAKLTGQEEQVIAARPTDNPEAYDAYLRGLSIEHERYSYPSYQAAVAEYKQAVQLDPKFASAWAHLATLQSFLYFNGVDTNTNSAAAVKEAADQAMTLQPDLAEAWIAQGAYRYRVLRDFESALQAFEEGRKRLPNLPLVYEFMAYVERRLGRWKEAEDHFNRAVVLDPQNYSRLFGIGAEFLNYLRRFDEAQAALNRCLEISPNDEGALAAKANLFQTQGRLQEAATTLSQIPADSTLDLVALVRSEQAILERRFDDAIAVLQRKLALTKPGELPSTSSKSFMMRLGYCQECAGRPNEAHAAFLRALQAFKPLPDPMVAPKALELPEVLALTYAGLGEKEKALAQAKQDVADYADDALAKPVAEVALAQIQARFGDFDAAIAALPHLLEVPAGITPALLRLDPMFDPLRNDPRFQKLCEEKQSENR
jgi:TolB-like protein/Tfp pilus assembly protein PilF